VTGSLAIFAGLTALAAAVGAVWLGRVARSGSADRGRALDLAARLILAAVFLLAAYGKLRDPYAFAMSIYAYRLVPPWAATTLAVLMPALEVLASLALVSRVLWRGGALILGTMLLVFVAALFQAILRGIDIECGCFGKGSSPVSFWLIARNYGLLLLALFPLVAERARARR
jgi:uncharacterized membrane protein YphA (DoxX/SURF4 family)